MVGASIFQMTFMMEVGRGAADRLAMKAVSPRDRVAQILMINVGFGTLVTALGATPVSILPPIMLALGYSSYVAIALPAIGYDSLCTYALLAIPAVVFTDVLAPLSGGGDHAHAARHRPALRPLHSPGHDRHRPRDVLDRGTVEDGAARAGPRAPDRRRGRALLLG